MTTTVYTAGYGGKSLDWLMETVSRLDADLFDIRFSPYSRNPVWRRANLEEALGERYHHVKALGNRNYKGGSIAIEDLDQGLALIAASERPVVLLCVCRDAATCHRTVVAEALGERGVNVREVDEG